MLLADQPRKVRCGIDRRDDDLGVELVAVLEDDAAGAAVRHLERFDAGAGADLGAELACRRGDRFGDLSGAALGKPPGAERTVDLAHVVVQQHVGRAGRADAEEGADDAD